MAVEREEIGHDDIAGGGIDASIMSLTRRESGAWSASVHLKVWVKLEGGREIEVDREVHVAGLRQTGRKPRKTPPTFGRD